MFSISLDESILHPVISLITISISKSLFINKFIILIKLSIIKSPINSTFLDFKIRGSKITTFLLTSLLMLFLIINIFFFDDNFQLTRFKGSPSEYSLNSYPGSPTIKFVSPSSSCDSSNLFSTK